MATARSSFFPRISLSGGADGPALPFYRPANMSSDFRRQPSEYALSDIVPQSEEEGLLLLHDPSSDRDHPSRHEQSDGLHMRKSSLGHGEDDGSNVPGSPGSVSKLRQQRILFTGPPPPIAASRLLYKDEEYGHYEGLDTSFWRPPGSLGGRSPGRGGGGGASAAASTIARSINSVLFDKGKGRGSRGGDDPKLSSHDFYEPDTAWRNLQRREKLLHKELQRLLDVQSTGLAANFDTAPPVEVPQFGSSDGASDTPLNSAFARSSMPISADALGNTPYSDLTTPSASSSPKLGVARHSSHDVVFGASITSKGSGRASPTGEEVVIPVRQPRPSKAMGLRAARAALGRTMGLLADLKAEEEAGMAAALAVRKKALSQLLSLAARRNGIAAELRALEGADEDEDEAHAEQYHTSPQDKGENDGEKRGSSSRRHGRQSKSVMVDPLTSELRELQRDRESVAEETAALESRLAGLRDRKRWLDTRIEDVRNKHEAGLSGYRGALREAEARMAGMLARPTVKPLDVEVVRAQQTESDQPSSQGEGYDEHHAAGHNNQKPGDEEMEHKLVGADFFRLRPERRTVEMAREWWEGEVAVLERCKAQVDRDRIALEEGLEIWREAVDLVTGFEKALRSEMSQSVAAFTTPSTALAKPVGELQSGSRNSSGSGKSTPRHVATPPPTTPKQAMRAQLDKMSDVMAALEERLSIAQDRGWNLLICAIGAELEAFRQAEAMLRDALSAASAASDQHDRKGTDDGDQSRLQSRSERRRESGDETVGGRAATVRGSIAFARATSNSGSSMATPGGDTPSFTTAVSRLEREDDADFDDQRYEQRQQLVDLQDPERREESQMPPPTPPPQQLQQQRQTGNMLLVAPGSYLTPKVEVSDNEVSDSEVPHDLLVAHPATTAAAPQDSPVLSGDGSEDEIPPEFLAEHRKGKLNT